MSTKVEVVDARGGDHVTITGEVLRKLIKDRIIAYKQQYETLMVRMLNELPSKEDAIPLMIALHLNDPSLNERALMFRAFIDRASWLDSEARQLHTLGQTFSTTAVYRITVADAARYGL